MPKECVQGGVSEKEKATLAKQYKKATVFFKSRRATTNNFRATYKFVFVSFPLLCF